MENKDVIAMLECIQSNVFCEDANRSYEYCQNTNCTECQVAYCRQMLEAGITLEF